MNRYTLFWLAAILAAPAAFGQAITGASHSHPPFASAHILVPQARGFTSAAIPGHVAVEIVERVATTTMDIGVTNAGGSPLEAQMVVPVPEGAAVRGFTFQGGAAEPTAELLTKEEARRAYDAIVASASIPAAAKGDIFTELRNTKAGSLTP